MLTQHMRRRDTNVYPEERSFLNPLEFERKPKDRLINSEIDDYNRRQKA